MNEMPVTPSEEPKKKSNTGLIIGIVVAVLLCCCCFIRHWRMVLWRRYCAITGFLIDPKQKILRSTRGIFCFKSVACNSFKPS